MHTTQSFVAPSWTLSQILKLFSAKNHSYMYIITIPIQYKISTKFNNPFKIKHKHQMKRYIVYSIFKKIQGNLQE